MIEHSEKKCYHINVKLSIGKQLQLLTYTYSKSAEDSLF